MAVSPGTILKAVSEMTMPGEHKAQNVWYWRLNSEGDQSEATILTHIAAKLNAIFAEIEDHIHADVTLDTVTVNEWVWDEVEGWETGIYIGEAALADAFVGAGDMLPHAVAATVTASTTDVNRRSRKSFAGFTETTQDDSKLSVAVVTAVAAAALEWVTAQVILGSDNLDPGLGGSDGVFYPLAVALVADILGSQRRRKPGLGI